MVMEMANFTQNILVSVLKELGLDSILIASIQYIDFAVYIRTCDTNFK